MEANADHIVSFIPLFSPTREMEEEKTDRFLDVTGNMYQLIPILL